MITPAVLITACGTLIMSTSTRLGRVVDRVRHLSNRFEELAVASDDLPLRADRQTFVFTQLSLNMKRARMLQRALSTLYAAVCCLIGSSGAIGFSAAVGSTSVWTPVALGLLGALLLFYASVVLILEARTAISHLQDEFEFRMRLSSHLAPDAILGGHATRRRARKWPLRRRSLGRDHNAT
jgi:hypothetical protein